MGYPESSNLLHRTPSGNARERCHVQSLRPARRWPERPPMDATTPPEHGTNTKSAQLTVGEKNYSVVMYEGTIGPEVIHISHPDGQPGGITYEPGLTHPGT